MVPNQRALCNRHQLGHGQGEEALVYMFGEEAQERGRRRGPDFRGLIALSDALDTFDASKLGILERWVRIRHPLNIRHHVAHLAGKAGWTGPHYDGAYLRIERPRLHIDSPLVRISAVDDLWFAWARPAFDVGRFGRDFQMVEALSVATWTRDPERVNLFFESVRNLGPVLAGQLAQNVD